jgi:hypothetical protein
MNAVLGMPAASSASPSSYNDLATPVTPSGKSAFDEEDVMAEMQWDQTPDLHQTFNIIRGRRIDPSDAACISRSTSPKSA